VSEPDVVRAGPDDWERVRAVRLQALADAPDAFWVTLTEELARTPIQWQERLAADSSATFLALQDGDAVGLCVVHPSESAPGDAGLAAMWIAPQARGSGVADAVIRSGIAWARAQGYPRLRLWINDANLVAARVYARHGFVRSGTVGSFPPPREHLTEHELALEL
jgi:RimJ/RimL family protein N-acetyltransferase